MKIIFNLSFRPHLEKTCFFHVRKQKSRSAAKLSDQRLYFKNQKFQASNHLLWQYCLVCVGPGRKRPRQQHGSFNTTPLCSDFFFRYYSTVVDTAFKRTLELAINIVSLYSNSIIYTFMILRQRNPVIDNDCIKTGNQSFII